MRGVLFKFLVWFIPLALFAYLRIDYNELTNLKDILLGSIGLSASALGFFIAGVSIMQTSNFSKFYKNLVELETNKKINAWLMASIGYLFVLSFLSILMLFFDLNVYNLFVEILFIVWISTLMASFIAGFYVVLIIIYVFSK